MQPLRAPLLLLFTILALAIGATHPSVAGELDRLPSLKSCENILPRTRAGFVAYFNPATGKLTSAPIHPSDAMPLQADDLYPFISLHAGLTTRAPNDEYVILDLKGRFQNGSLAVVDRRGKTHIIRIGSEIFKSEAGRCMLSQIAHNRMLGFQR